MSESALGRIRNQTTITVNRVRSVSNRVLIAAKDREDALFQASLEEMPPLEQRREDLLQFYKEFESLVDVLCDAAHYGPVPKLEAEYERLRSWIQRAYPEVRRYIVAFLRFSPEDAQMGLSLWGRSADAFEALVAAPTLAQMLRCDDGHLISRINRTREALNQYAEHLRRLKAQV